jgi:hypothetical protein
MLTRGLHVLYPSDVLEERRGEGEEGGRREKRSSEEGKRIRGK